MIEHFSFPGANGCEVLGDRMCGAVLSRNAKYRHALWRVWNTDLGVACWIMLNPSTANHLRDDHTIRKCINFSRRWGCGGLYVVNLFALRSTDPKLLYSEENPVGLNNDSWIRVIAERSQLVVAAWGNHGVWLGRNVTVRGLLRHLNVACLGRCANGEPKHPLMLGYSTPLQAFINKPPIDAINQRIQAC